jgi:hypothetical protein
MENRKISLAIAGILLLMVMACSLPGISFDSTAPVKAAIESPAPGARLPLGPVSILYSASSSAGIAEVEFSVNGAVVMRVTDVNQSISISEFDWMPDAPGDYTLSVRARSDENVWSDDSQVSITIEKAPQPTPTAGLPTATPEPAATPMPFRIFDVEADEFTIYYGDDDCGGQDVTITARVNYPGQVNNVVLFTRLADQESTQTTNWDSGRSMSKASDDTYRVTLDADDIPNYNKYEFATLLYQIVATGANSVELGRTSFFKNVHLEVCPQPNTPEEVRFKNYSTDTDIFYFGSGTCGESEVVISTDVTRQEKVEYVILFTRFKDLDSDAMTNWDRGSTMRVIDENTHRITLRAEDLANFDEYERARMSYQFIATDKDDKITGRSLVFDDIILQRCP